MYDENVSNGYNLLIVFSNGTIYGELRSKVFPNETSKIIDTNR